MVPPIIRNACTQTSACRAAYFPLIFAATVIEGIGTGLGGPPMLQTSLRAVLPGDTGAAAAASSTANQDINQETWISAAIAAGVPADYAAMLRWLTGAIIAGNGSTPADDIQAILGRSATSFKAFAERNAPAWTALEGK